MLKDRRQTSVSLLGTLTLTLVLLAFPGSAPTASAFSLAKKHGSHHGHKHHRKHRRKTVRSTGGPISVKLASISVQAPRGAIKKGQTLTLERGSAKGFASPGTQSLVGGPYSISTSQGEPAKPVKVSFRYQAGRLASEDRPLVLHGWRGLKLWVPERTSDAPAGATASAWLESFSPIDVVNQITWAAGDITGNRTDLPDGCGPPPSWIDGVVFPGSRNDSLPACTSSRSNAQTLYINIANNRGYAQFVTISNATLNVQRSDWGDSLEGLFANQIAAHSPGNSPSSFVLAPGSHATLAIDGPPASLGGTAVSLRAAPKGASAAAEIGWALLMKVREDLGTKVDISNCVIGAVHQTLSTDPGATGVINTLRSCASAGAAKLTGAAKEAFSRITAAILVTDFFYKLIDIETDEAYPPKLSFSIRGANPTNPAIHLGDLDFGELPAGELSVEHLSASGGKAPYEFGISHSAANTAAVPDWVDLAPDGTLTIDPPAGTLRSVGFYVYATDATGQSSPFERDEVRFSVGPGDGDHEQAGAWVPTRAPVPAGAEADVVDLYEAACSPEGTCVAVGSYSKYGGTAHPLIETLSGTHWVASEPPLPAAVGPSHAGLTSVSCTTGNLCVAVGGYRDPEGHEHRMLDTLSAGSWTSVAAPTPAGSDLDYAFLETTACSANGECLIAGPASEGGEGRLLIETSSGGSWSPSFAPLGSGFTGYLPYLTGLACDAEGTCLLTALHYGENNEGGTLVETRSGGVWSPSSPLAPPDSHPFATSLGAAGCMPPPGGCLGFGGSYEEDGTEVSIVDTFAGGTWTSERLPMPSDIGLNAARYGQASCPEVGACFAVGGYEDAGDFGHGLVLTLAEGKWFEDAAPIPPGDEAVRSGLFSISCYAIDGCVAVGHYIDPGHGHYEPGLIETLDGGGWVPSEAPLPGDGSVEFGELHSVACAPSGTCVAVGSYDGLGGDTAYLETRPEA
jgi:hypothetical protein